MAKNLTAHDRITSTYVEKTVSVDLTGFFVWDHLHIRGENDCQSLIPIWFGGSPPHTWRKRRTFSSLEKKEGITSTYVEKTFVRPTAEKQREDHLHIRGENQFISCCVKNLPGSPPHTWRKPKKNPVVKPFRFNKKLKFIQFIFYTTIIIPVHPLSFTPINKSKLKKSQTGLSSHI